MIRKLRRRFVLISVAVLSVVMLTLTFVINIANWTSVQSEIAETVAELSMDRPIEPRMGKNGKNRHGKHGESIYESRYFIATGTPDDITVDISNVSSYTEEEAEAMASAVLASDRESGFADECYFRKNTSEGRITVLFLDCGSRLASARELMLISLISCGAGILVAWLLMEMLSGRAVRPFVENAEKQKRFITDASHELKTPLSVIGANMEVLAMDDPDNEWIISTRRQTGLMTRMVNDMVFLTRADEGLQSAMKSEIDLTQLLKDTAEPFTMMAESGGRVLDVSAAEDVRFRGERKGVERLISILCDNALKYSPQGDKILLSLSVRGGFAVIETENKAAEPIAPEKLKHIFDRFYRADDSRARKDGKSGFGIGLAIARAVCEAHGGDARAFPEGERIRIQCRLRLR